MSTTLIKSDPLFPAFAAKGNLLKLRKGASIVGEKLNPEVKLPKVIVPGQDYAVRLSNGVLKAERLIGVPKAGTLGGFHVGLDGAIAVHSIWDSRFRPSCKDPRGMVFIPSVGWVDIYLLNTEPHKFGSSASGKTIADGFSDVLSKDGNRKSLTWWNTLRILSEF